MTKTEKLIKASSRFTNLLFITMAIFVFAAAFPMEDNPRTIEVIGNDNLRFDVNEIRVKAGETIRIVLKVKSSMPADAMSHNLAIVSPDIPMDEFISESMKAKNNEYIAISFEDQVIATTAMIGGGKTTEITFTVPEDPGIYPYVCTFPGHYAAGMVGELIVES